MGVGVSHPHRPVRRRWWWRRRWVPVVAVLRWVIRNVPPRTSRGPCTLLLLHLIHLPRQRRHRWMSTVTRNSDTNNNVRSALNPRRRRRRRRRRRSRFIHRTRRRHPRRREDSPLPSSFPGLPPERETPTPTETPAIAPSPRVQRRPMLRVSLVPPVPQLLLLIIIIIIISSSSSSSSSNNNNSNCSGTRVQSTR